MRLYKYYKKSAFYNAPLQVVYTRFKPVFMKENTL